MIKKKCNMILILFFVFLFFGLNTAKASTCTYYSKDGNKLEYDITNEKKISFYRNGKHNWTTATNTSITKCFEYTFYNQNGGISCGLSLNGCNFKSGSSRNDLITHMEDIGGEGFNWASLATLGIGCFFGMDCGFGDGDSRYELFFYLDKTSTDSLNAEISSYNQKIITNIGSLAENVSKTFNVDTSGKGTESFAKSFFSNNSCTNLKLNKSVNDMSDNELLESQTNIKNSIKNIDDIMTNSDDLLSYGKETVVPLLEVNTAFTSSNLSSLSNYSNDSINSVFYTDIANMLIDVRDNYNKFFAYSNGSSNKYQEFLTCLSEKNELIKSEIDRRLKKNEENKILLEAQRKAELIHAEITDAVERLVKGIDSNFYKDNGPLTCEGILGQDIIKWLKSAFLLIQIGTIIIVIVMTMLDFVKAITSGEADIMKKVWKNFSRRLIVLVILFLAPVLVNFILKIFNISGVDPNNPLCF